MLEKFTMKAGAAFNKTSARQQDEGRRGEKRKENSEKP
jgi:hypothetical protein